MLQICVVWKIWPRHSILPVQKSWKGIPGVSNQIGMILKTGLGYGHQVESLAILYALHSDMSDIYPSPRHRYYTCIDHLTLAVDLCNIHALQNDYERCEPGWFHRTKHLWLYNVINHLKANLPLNVSAKSEKRRDLGRREAYQWMGYTTGIMFYWNLDSAGILSTLYSVFTWHPLRLANYSEYVQRVYDPRVIDFRGSTHNRSLDIFAQYISLALYTHVCFMISAAISVHQRVYSAELSSRALYECHWLLLVISSL